jgi:hypothetical protein
VEGLGYSNIDNYQSIYTNTLSASNFACYPDWDSSSTRTMMSNGGVFPTVPLKYNYYNEGGFDRQPRGLMSGTFRGHANILNTAWLGT